MAKTVDLRTYLLLERAFVRRLQRSWRQQSAPIYAKITQACLDHKWDEARRLVPELDMAEVGTDNREWITYMLLSCAVFGANTVSKRKPSFVGVGTFDTFLKQTTSNILQYLEFTATARVQREALQLIAEDEAKTKALPKVAWDKSQPRDEQGRWTADAVGQALIKAGRTTTDPNLTAFLLPNGTRVTAGGYNSHAKLAMAAGYNDLNKVIESGVVRYIPGVGIEANHLTETQARIVVEDWEAYFAGPHGWNAIQVDLVGREDRLILGSQVLSRQFDRLSVDALLNFVNGPRTTKWDDAKHPRDKQGQFTESGAGFTEVERQQIAGEYPIEGGHGPVRAEWVKLNKASMAAFDALQDAREAHDVLEAPIRALFKANGTAEEIRALETKIHSDLAYQQSVQRLEILENASGTADLALKAIEPAMRKEVVTNLSTNVAEKMGVSPRIIDVVDKDPPSFKVGEKEFNEAGHYDPSTGRVEINSRNASYGDAPAVKGLTAHELSHAIFHSLKLEVDAEFAQYLKKALTPDGHRHTEWYTERFELIPGTATRRMKPEYQAELAKEFPAATVMAGLAKGNLPGYEGLFQGISQRMVDENGHSAYARSYWTPAARAARGNTYDAAINETIAEVTRWLTYPGSWREPSPPQPTSPWVKLTQAMHEWYAKRGTA